MADEQKPERLGGLGKTTSGRARKFAPKSQSKRSAPGDARGGSAAGPAGAGEAAGASGEDDAFKDLIAKSKLAGQGRGARSSLPRDHKFMVSFGGTGATSNSGAGMGILNAKPAAPKGASGGGGGGSSSSSKARAAAKPAAELPALPGETLRDGRPLKERQPMFDERRHYPVTVPFTEVITPYDPDKAPTTLVPEDLCPLEDPGEGNTAAVLGLQAPIANGPLLLVQLPSLLPSQALQDAAKQAGAGKEASTSAAAAPSAMGFRAPEQPAFLSGAQAVQHLGGGKIGSVKFLKSGKVRVQIGSLEYIVTAGVESKSRSELHWAHLKTSDSVFSGDMDLRAVVALDMESMLETRRTSLLSKQVDTTMVA